MPAPGPNLGLRRLLSDSAYNLIRQVWGILLGLGVSILLARILGKEARGIYTMAVLLPEVLFTFLNLGVAPAIVYFIGSRKKEPAQIIQDNIIPFIGLSLAGMLLGMLLSWYAGAIFFPNIPKHFLLISLIGFPLQLLTALLLAVFQGKQDFRNYNFANMVSSLLLFILVLIMVGLLKWQIYGALAANILSKLIGVALLLEAIRRQYRPKFGLPNRENWRSFKNILRYGLKAYLANCVAYLNYRSDYFLLNLLTGAVPVGIYSVSVGLVERLWVPTTSLTTVLLPRIASLQNDETRQSQLTTLTGRFSFWFSLLLVLLFWPLVGILIPWLYSTEFSAAVLPFRLLLPGIVALNLSKIIASDIAGRGKPEINLYITLLSAAINIGSNLILIPRYGVNGAAAASSFSYIVQTFAVLGWYCQFYHVPWSSFFILTSQDWQYLRTLLNMALNKIKTF